MIGVYLQFVCQLLALIFEGISATIVGNAVPGSPYVVDDILCLSATLAVIFQLASIFIFVGMHLS
jgi:hypothetical protein